MPANEISDKSESLASWMVRLLTRWMVLMGRQTLCVDFSALMNRNGVIGSEWVLNWVNYFKRTIGLIFALSVIAVVLQQNHAAGGLW